MAEHRDTPEQPYTVHDDVDAPSSESLEAPEEVPAGRRGGPDPVGLVVGLLALAVAVLALTDTLTAVDGRWVLAGGAVLVGIAVLAATSRPRARSEAVSAMRHH